MPRFVLAGPHAYGGTTAETPISHCEPQQTRSSAASVKPHGYNHDGEAWRGEGATAPTAKMEKEPISGALHPDNNLLSVLILPSTCDHLWQQGAFSVALLLRHQMGNH